MHLSRQFLVATAGIALSLSAVCAPLLVSGVRFDETIKVNENPVHLNGAGIRYKAVFKVYAAGLYLDKKAATPEEAYAVPGAKRIAITMLRDIDPKELGKLFTAGITDNAPKAEMSKLMPGLIRTGEIFSTLKKLNAGEGFTIDWIPGTGTVFSVNGLPVLAPVKEPEYFTALMRIWLGPNPADWKLKEAMLGKPA